MLRLKSWEIFFDTIYICVSYKVKKDFKKILKSYICSFEKNISRIIYITCFKITVYHISYPYLYLSTYSLGSFDKYHTLTLVILVVPL